MEEIQESQLYQAVRFNIKPSYMSITKTEFNTHEPKTTSFQTFDVTVSGYYDKNKVTKDDLIDFFGKEVSRLNGFIQQNVDKIKKLTSLFGVVKSGTTLSTSHQVMFNHNNDDTDKMGQLLLEEFFEQYGLNLEDVKKGVEVLKDTISIMKNSEATQYCEVDIFNPEKEPVEC
jgi:hypothetical protein